MNQRSHMIPTSSDVKEACRRVTEDENSEAPLKLLNHREPRMRPWMASGLQEDLGANELRLICEYFAKFVPETVQRLVAANPEMPDFSMRERDVSVLFIDISGYSSLILLC